MGEGGATGASSSEGPCPRFWHQARNLAAVSFDLLPAPRLPSSSGCPPGEVGDIGGGRARFGKPHNRKTQQPGVHPGNTRSLRHQQHQQRELNTHTTRVHTRHAYTGHGAQSPEGSRHLLNGVNSGSHRRSCGQSGRREGRQAPHVSWQSVLTFISTSLTPSSGSQMLSCAF